MITAQEDATLRKLYWTSFALRAGLGVTAWLLSLVYQLPFMEDASAYSMNAAGVANDWLNGRASPWMAEAMEGGRKAWFMVMLLACFYCLTGGYEAIPFAILAQCLLTAATPGLAYRAGRRLGLPPDGALFAGRLIAFSPAFVFWAGALYKEGVILIALFLLIDHTLRLQQEFRPISAGVVTLTLVAMFGLRFYLAAIFSLAIVVGLVFGRSQARSPNPLAAGVRQIIILLFVVSAFALLGIGDRVGNLVGGDLNESFAQINNSRRDLASYRSGYLRDADVSTPDKALRFLPVGLAYFLTVPLPWHIGSARQNMAILETLAWVVVVYPLAYRGVVRGVRANPQGVLFLLLASVATCAFYAVFVGNIGTAYRVRVQVWAIWALFAGWGWAARARRRAVEPPAQTAATRPPSRPPARPAWGPEPQHPVPVAGRGRPPRPAV